MSDELTRMAEELNGSVDATQNGEVAEEVIKEKGWDPAVISAYTIVGETRGCPNKCGCSSQSGAGETIDGEHQGNCGSACGCTSNAGAGCHSGQGNNVSKKS